MRALWSTMIYILIAISFVLVPTKQHICIIHYLYGDVIWNLVMLYIES